MMNDDTQTGSTTSTARAQGPVMRDASPTREDAARREALLRNRSSTIKAMVITLGVVIAPFLALAFSLDFALIVLAAALAFTTVVTWGGARRANPALRGRLYASVALNGALTAVMIVVVIVRMASN